jgi:hypothetical protein
LDLEFEEIRKRYIEATGGEGRAAILTAQTLIFKGTTDETWKRKVVPYEVRYKAPNNWIIRQSLPDGTLTYAISGKDGWVQDAKEARILKERELVLIRETIDSMQLLPQLPSSKPVSIIKDKIQNREAVRLEFKLKGGDSEYFFFDSQSYLLLARKRITISPVGSIPQEIRYENYREIAGAKVPYTVRSAYVDPWTGGNFIFTEILLNAPISDAEFRMPESSPLKESAKTP